MSRLSEDFKQNLLQVVNAVVPVSRASFYEVDESLEPRSHVVMGGDTRWIRAYDSYRASDPFHPRRFQAVHGSVFSDRDAPLDSRLHAAYVGEFMHRIGVMHKAEVFIRDSRQRIIAGVRLGRGEGIGAFDADALERLHMLLPVISRACLALVPESGLERFQLTPREAQVLDGLVEGLPDKLIARQLQVSLPTVKLHARSLYRKLGVRGRSEAVSLAYRSGRTG